MRDEATAFSCTLWRTPLRSATLRDGDPDLDMNSMFYVLAAVNTGTNRSLSCGVVRIIPCLLTSPLSGKRRTALEADVTEGLVKTGDSCSEFLGLHGAEYVRRVCLLLCDQQRHQALRVPKGPIHIPSRQDRSVFLARERRPAVIANEF